MISDNIKLQIKENNDIVSIIRQYVPSLKQNGNHFKGLCPFHNEKTPSFVVYPESQHFYCFGCQKSGDVFSFVMEHEGFDFMDALRFLGQQVGIDVDAEDAQGPAALRNRSQKNDLFKLHEDLANTYHQLLFSEYGKLALDYCHQRGLSDELIRRFRIGYAPNSFDYVKNWGKSQGYSFETMLLGGVLSLKNPEDNPVKAYDRWRHRLMFPISNPQGKIIGFSGRVLDQEQKGGKYVNSPETPIFHKSNVLYGVAQARDGIKDWGFAVVCEGQMDVIASHAAGVTNAVAPQGTAFTEAQARLLKRYSDNVTLCFDSDSAGINAAIKSIEPLVAAELNARVAVLQQGEDPDSIARKQGAEALQNFIKNSVDIFEFLLNVTLHANGNTPAGKSQTVQTFLEYVSKLPSPVVRSEYCRFAAEKLALELQPVFDELNRILNKARRKSVFSETQEQGRAVDASSEPPPFDSGDLSPTTAPSNAVYLAEAHLLDLCLNHERYANQLEQQLGHERISNSPAGKALNDLLAYTAQGEWDMAKELFTEDINKYNCPELVRALNEPWFGQDREAKDLEACFNGCVSTVMLEYLAGQNRAKEQEMRSTNDPSRKKEIMRELLELDSEIRKYRKH